MNGDNVIPEIHRTLGKMEALVESIHSGERTGHSGARFTDVVSIGIGGSFLGPKLAVEALRPYDGDASLCNYTHPRRQRCKITTKTFIEMNLTISRNMKISNWFSFLFHLLVSMAKVLQIR